LVDYEETPEEELKRLKSQERAVNPISGGLQFIFQIFLWMFIIPTLCVGAYHFVKYVIGGDLTVSKFFSSINDFSYDIVLSFYINILYKVKSLF